MFYWRFLNRSSNKKVLKQILFCSSFKVKANGGKIKNHKLLRQKCFKVWDMVTMNECALALIDDELFICGLVYFILLVSRIMTNNTAKGNLLCLIKCRFTTRFVLIEQKHSKENFKKSVDFYDVYINILLYPFCWLISYYILLFINLTIFQIFTRKRKLRCCGYWKEYLSFMRYWQSRQ